MAAPVSPFVLAVHDVIHRPGELRERELDFSAPEQFGEGAAVVPTGSEMHISARIEGLHEGILLTGRVETTAIGECVRCLDPVSIPVDVDLQELFAYVSDEAFDYTVVEDRIDLEPLVRDAVVLALPFQPLCRPDCPGIDPRTGDKRDVSAGLGDDPRDPRWAALDGFQADN